MSVMVLSGDDDGWGGSRELREGLGTALDSMIEERHCLEQDKVYGTGDGSQCRMESQSRMNRFQDEVRRRQEARDAQRQQEETEQERQRQKEQRFRELANGPHPSEEMRVRFGNVVTFEECMTVYRERNATELGLSSEVIRNACLGIVSNTRSYCERTGDNRCAEKGVIHYDQSMAARDDRARESAERQRQVRAEQADNERQRQEDERLRRQALLDQWLRSGGKRKVCPNVETLLNKNHPCHF
jgi:hypothetical protein